MRPACLTSRLLTAATENILHSCRLVDILFEKDTEPLIAPVATLYVSFQCRTDVSVEVEAFDVPMRRFRVSLRVSKYVEAS